ncbi:hypothetical protein [Streptomyces nodosus]
MRGSSDASRSSLTHRHGKIAARALQALSEARLRKMIDSVLAGA